MVIGYWLSRHICISRLGPHMFLERFIENLMKAMDLFPSASYKYIHTPLRILIPSVHESPQCLSTNPQRVGWPDFLVNKMHVTKKSK